jgi:FixJ family two-component response regulator
MLAPPGKTNRPRVLLVEDDPAVRRSTQLLLSSEGYEVRSYAKSAGLAEDPEALKAECLVADLLIEDGDALALLHDLRRAGWDGPAVLISGHLNDEWARRALDQGYAAALAKPVADGVLKGWVARLLEAGKAPGPSARESGR